MYITVNKLKDLNACKEGIEFFQQHYPNGGNLIDVLQNPELSIDAAQWGYVYLGFDTDAELAAKEDKLYTKLMEVKNTPHWYLCYQVSDSDWISNSRRVSNSQYVKDSRIIIDSDNVVYSSAVERSSEVFLSKFVYDSKHILDSMNITRSEMVIKSKYIIDSRNVIDSNTINCSTDIQKSENISMSKFCQDSKNLHHCMFCNLLADKSYYLFNQPVDETIFNIAFEQYKMIMPAAFKLMSDYKPNRVSMIMPQAEMSHKEYYSVLVKNRDILDWLKSLPHYNSMMMYQLTHCEYFLNQ